MTLPTTTQEAPKPTGNATISSLQEAKEIFGFESPMPSPPFSPLTDNGYTWTARISESSHAPTVKGPGTSSPSTTTESHESISDNSSVSSKETFASTDAASPSLFCQQPCQDIPFSLELLRADISFLSLENQDWILNAAKCLISADYPWLVNGIRVAHLRR
ncbi:hypothetical protein S40285_10487 [Stachybotrys chlorohalonatus IBT 40285]|uniref:Uncharacterized protein n=1 Tax=Stachybotrys chlorohalonatus (strain IBT 40285) TaxID=1283841 RepID=A0A084QWH6_STAC4|nr:hypothetical protein S40285_10487 [Stachybotrys chlorohalonata IBT 40285]